MNSTRLPGKVLREVAGRPMLRRQIERMRQCRAADEIVLATTTHAADDPVAALARECGVRWFRGSEQDVLSRFVGAAREAAADVVVRVTADCPLIDPGVLDRVIADLADNAAACDYSANVLRRTYPRGLDCEAMFFDVLLRVDRLAVAQADREHVTLLPRSGRPELFLCRSVQDAQDNSDLRWTVDTQADLDTVRAVYEGMGLGDRVAPYREVLAYVRARPEIARMNAEVMTWDPRASNAAGV